jgi:hypothetical protein
MSHQLSEKLPSETARAWDTVRRVRELVAWALLVLAAIIVVVSACQLFNLAGAKIPGLIGPAPVSAFALRASAVAPQFIEAIVIAPPVLSVVLVAFCGGLTEHARQVVQTVEAPGVALVLTALVFTGAMLWSRELRSLAPRFVDVGDDGEDFEDDPALGEHD